MLPDFDFRKLSAFHKNGFVSRAECFIAAPGTKPTSPNRQTPPTHRSFQPPPCGLLARHGASAPLLPEGLPSASAVSGRSRAKTRNDRSGEFWQARGVRAGGEIHHDQHNPRRASGGGRRHQSYRHLARPDTGDRHRPPRRRCSRPPRSKAPTTSMSSATRTIRPCSSSRLPA